MLHTISKLAKTVVAETTKPCLYPADDVANPLSTNNVLALGVHEGISSAVLPLRCIIEIK
jgi:hypothetical protein